MWLFNRLPTEQLKTRYQFTPDAAWAEHLMKSSVRFNNGGSGSFVSSDGLVMTNHHVAADMLQKISTPDHDYYKLGFYATKQADEKRALDLELNQLVGIEDVTEQVNQAVAGIAANEEAAKARRAAMAAIEKKSFDATGLRSDVVPLYEGGMYHLYKYKKYTDVRLVFCPEFAIAFFGGDPDNFEFPRYDLDFCLFRVYENDQPAKLADFLRWSAKGAADRELVFVSGHPGATHRLYTVDAIRTMRDVRLPYTLDLLRKREANLLSFSAKGEENARRAKEDLFGVQNSRKAYVGRAEALRSKQFIVDKEKEETKLKQRTKDDPKLKTYGDAWKTIETSEAVYRRLFLKRALFEQKHAFDSRLYDIARTLVRMPEEDSKPNGQRLDEFRENRRPSLEQALYSEAPIYPDLEISELTRSLTFLVEKLGAGDATVKTILAGKTPADRAKELVEGSKLADVALRKQIAAGKKDAIAQSKDPMILLAVAIDPEARALRKEYEDKVEEPERQAFGKLSRLRFEIYGASEYPDATFTLRLAFGEVKGYASTKGKTIPPWTTLDEAFGHEKRHGAKDPYALPKSWHDHQKQIPAKTPFNFVSTDDIIGGNSGSPVVNRAGEVVGLIFDGNIESLAADYYYSDKQARAVAVHSEGIRQALDKIYGAGELAQKLGK